MKINYFAIVLLLCMGYFPLICVTLQLGFYQTSCPQAESTITNILRQRIAADRSIVAPLLRMYYHDCFVRGCDASILIDSTQTNQAEKDAGVNLSLQGFDLIDDIKNNLETICPGLVSCADIIALATRDAIALAGGPSFGVPTGRRDGVVSRISEVNLPGPRLTISQAQQVFAAKGLTLNDMILLLGAHTVGLAHCSFFRDRLFNFQGSGAPDLNMDPSMANVLQMRCGSDPNVDRTVFLEPNTPLVVDNQYYKEILNNRGVLQIDQNLGMDQSTFVPVTMLASNNALFRQEFGKALIKLGNVQVLEGNKGEIRKKCRVIN